MSLAPLRPLKGGCDTWHQTCAYHGTLGGSAAATADRSSTVAVNRLLVSLQASWSSNEHSRFSPIAVEATRSRFALNTAQKF